ncbi:uncharacterized protein ARMOST_22242 [Armillaria ostoyae]|uniref:Uncharacterized protein n=1 Tax=Armillaria ostoyae TaxID=47428 RepID=A0A284SCB2_ARMOS|nr:uncharacterized protein ARMOST_22242 [Armillaria ostoyae]
MAYAIVNRYLYVVLRYSWTMEPPPVLAETCTSSLCQIPLIPNIGITPLIVDYVAYHVADMVNVTKSLPPAKPPINFVTFVASVLRHAGTRMIVVLAFLVYMDRVRPRIRIGPGEHALERVFLGALILASKAGYFDDITTKNIQWARYSAGLFGKRGIGVIEREFLAVLDFKLYITEIQLLGHASILHTMSSHLSSSCIPPPTSPSSESPVEDQVRRQPGTVDISQSIQCANQCPSMPVQFTLYEECVNLHSSSNKAFAWQLDTQLMPPAPSWTSDIGLYCPPSLSGDDAGKAVKFYGVDIRVEEDAGNTEGLFPAAEFDIPAGSSVEDAGKAESLSLSTVRFYGIDIPI